MLLAAAAGACDRSAEFSRQARADSVAAITAESAERARQDSVNRAQPGYIIDSLLPVEEEVRRFRAAVGGSVATELARGSPSVDSLVARFARAVARSDTADLLRMALTPREFIDLYYPESPHTHPPYRQSPGFLWGQLELSGSKGLVRLLERRGGKPLRLAGVRCDANPQRQGRNALWSRCEVIVRDENGAEHRERLFGSIIERDGWFKFMSFANQY